MAQAQERLTAGTTSGEFSVGATGQASYRIPLEVPPGTAGFAPELALVYSSSGKNGLAGAGWSLTGLPVITRCPPIPTDGINRGVYGGESDAFCLEGETLVRTGGDYDGVSTYRAYRDTWSQVTGRAWKNILEQWPHIIGPAWFEVQTRDGKYLEFGKTAGARVITNDDFAIGSRTAVYFALNRITDRHGNSMDVTYLRAGNVLHPKQITYGGRRVELIYETRPDRPFDFGLLVAMRSDRRLVGVEMYLDPAGPGSPASPQLVRRYELAYDQSPTTGASLLRSVRECDSGGACLPHIELSYDSYAFDGTFDTYYPPGSTFQDDLRFDPGARIVPGDFNGDGITDFIRQEQFGRDDDNNNSANVYLATGSTFTRVNFPSSQINLLKGDHVYLHVADYTGDGRDDFLRQTKTGTHTDVTLFASNGNGTFTMHTVPGGGIMSNEYVRLFPGDFNGDGRADFFRHEYNGVGDGFVSIYYSEGTTFRRVIFAQQISLSRSDVDILTNDFDGDGRTDLMIRKRKLNYTGSNHLSGQAEIWFSRGEGEFQRVGHVGFPIYPMITTDSNVIFGDFNGDGKGDFVRQERGVYSVDGDYEDNFQVYLSTGVGFHMVQPGAEVAGDWYQDKCRYEQGAQLIPGDFNGDGMTDLIRREIGAWQTNDAGTFQVMLSRGDGTFDVYQPPGDHYQRGLRADLGAHIIVGDFDGDGQSDFLRQEHTDWDHDTDKTFSIFKNIDTRPDLLETIDEGRGLITSITYTPITRNGIYTRVGPGGHPGVPLGSPMYVVQGYEQVDAHRGGPAREYSFTYEDGRYLPDGRGFLGFRRTSRIDHHVGLQTNSFYEQAWPFQSFVTRTEIRRVADGTLVKSIASTYEVTHPVPETEFLALASVEVTHVEAGGTYQTRKEYSYDAYGNLALEVDRGVVAHAGDDVATCTVYANNPVTWRLGLAAEVVDAASCDASCACTGILGRRRTAYDERGRPIRSEVYESEADRWIGESIGYDAYGNVIRKTNAAGGIIEYTFDEAYHTFPTAKVIDAAGAQLTTAYAFSPAFGALLREERPDGSVFRREIDGFGRTVRMYGPGPSGEVLLSELSLQDGRGDRYEEVRALAAFGEQRFITTRTYFDAFDRPYRIETRESPTSVPIVVETTYDAEGRVVSQSQPHHPGEAAAATTYEYDAAGRIVRATLPHGAMQEAEYAFKNTVCNGCVLQRTVIENRGLPEERRIVHQLDGRMQVRRRDHGDGTLLRYTLDRAGRVTQYHDDTASTTIGYDSLGRVKLVASVTTGSTFYTYDAAGRLSSISDGMARNVTFEYDVMNRVLAKQFSDGQRLILSYDDPDGAGTAGRLSSATVEKNGVVKSRFDYGYDGFGQLSSKAISYEGQTYTFTMTYGPDGQPTSLTYPDGSMLVHAYDGLNRLQALRLDGVEYAAYEDYTALGAPRAVHYGNGVDTTFEYATHGVLQRHRIVGPGDGTTRATLLDQELHHDRRLQVTRIVDHVRAEEQELFYDTRGFLTEVRSPVLGTRTYAYDTAGNLTNRDGVTQVYDRHRIVSDSNGASYQYDVSGNRTSMQRDGALHTYSYDAARRLTRVVRDGQQVGAYEYDPEGMRIRKTDADGTVTIYLTPQYEIARFPDGRSVHTRYLFDHTGRVAAVTLDGTIAEPLIVAHQALLAAQVSSDAGGGAAMASASSFDGARAALPKETAIVGLLAFGLFVLAGFAVARGHSVPRTAFQRLHPRMAPVVPIVLAAFVVAVVPGCKPEREGLTASEVLVPGDNGYGYPVAGSFFFHQDRVGTTTIVTDAQGQAVSKLVYLPYGEIYQPASEGADVFRSKFGDKELDRDPGLYYFDSRYYDPVAGRFLTADTYVVGGDPDLPGALNRYQFAGNNPISHADPTGHHPYALLAIVILLPLGLGGASGWLAGVDANNGEFDPKKWDWNAKTISAVTVNFLLGTASATVTFPVAFVLAAGNSVVTSLIVGDRGEEVIQNLALDLSLGVGGRTGSKALGAARQRAAAAVKPRMDNLVDRARTYLGLAAGRASPDAGDVRRAISLPFGLNPDDLATLAFECGWSSLFNLGFFTGSLHADVKEQRPPRAASYVLPIVRMSGVRGELDPAALVAAGTDDLGLVITPPQAPSLCLVCTLGPTDGH